VTLPGSGIAGEEQSTKHTHQHANSTAAHEISRLERDVFAKEFVSQPAPRQFERETEENADEQLAAQEGRIDLCIHPRPDSERRRRRC